MLLSILLIVSVCVQNNVKSSLKLCLLANIRFRCKISQFVNLSKEVNLIGLQCYGFIQLTRPTSFNSVLLVLKGHYNHTPNVNIIDMAHEKSCVYCIITPTLKSQIATSRHTVHGSPQMLL